MCRLPPSSTLFPYTTLFRSRERARRLFPLVLLGVAVVSLWTPAIVPEIRELWFSFRSEEHTSELQSRRDLVCRLLLEKKKNMLKRWSALSHDASPRAHNYAL